MAQQKVKNKTKQKTTADRTYTTMGNAFKLLFILKTLFTNCLLTSFLKNLSPNKIPWL